MKISCSGKIIRIATDSRELRRLANQMEAVEKGYPIAVASPGQTRTATYLGEGIEIEFHTTNPHQ